MADRCHNSAIKASFSFLILKKPNHFSSMQKQESSERKHIFSSDHSSRRSGLSHTVQLKAPFWWIKHTVHLFPPSPRSIPLLVVFLSDWTTQRIVSDEFLFCAKTLESEDKRNERNPSDLKEENMEAACVWALSTGFNRPALCWFYLGAFMSVWVICAAVLVGVCKKH